MGGECTRRYLRYLAALSAASGLVQLSPAVEAGAVTTDQAVVSQQAHAALSQTAVEPGWCQIIWGQNVICVGEQPAAGGATADESLAAILQQI